MEDKKVNIAHIITLVFLKDLISEVKFQAKWLISQEIQESPTSPIHQIARKLDFSNATTSTKGTESKAIQFSQMPGIE